MAGNWRLFVVRAAHTAIYVVMASATLVVLYAGVTGATGRWLWIALALVLLEAAVFGASGMKCPLTAVAVRYGATPEGAYDTFFPERFTRHTLTVFGPLMGVGVGLLLIRWIT
ncbi:hypothetical protein [Brevundimonas sp.]|uniref:hypothetical protein n=1 Tax=Brevundimonas sp. TaxID=1871086 RepID=UPI002FCAF4A6